MVQNYKVVTLCGSTRFKEQFMETQKRLTLEGCIVISVGLFGHSGDDEVWKPGTKEMLDDMHLRKIDMADEIYFSFPCPLSPMIIFYFEANNYNISIWPSLSITYVVKLVANLRQLIAYLLISTAFH